MMSDAPPGCSEPLTLGPFVLLSHASEGFAFPDGKLGLGKGSLISGRYI